MLVLSIFEKPAPKPTRGKNSAGRCSFSCAASASSVSKCFRGHTMAICVSQFALFAVLHRTERCTVQERLTQRFPRRRLISSPNTNCRPCAVLVFSGKCGRSLFLRPAVWPALRFPRGADPRLPLTQTTQAAGRCPHLPASNNPGNSDARHRAAY